MANTPRDVTEAELAVLAALWDAPECTIRRIVDQLYPGGGASQYATVHAVWMLVLIKLVTPPLVRVPVDMSVKPQADLRISREFAGETVPPEANLMTFNGAVAVKTVADALPIALLSLWGAGSIVIA